MSIPSVLAQIDSDFLTKVLWFALIAVPLTVAAMAGVFSPTSIIGPQRLSPGEPVAPLWVCMLAGLFVWMLVPATYGAARTPPSTQPTTATTQVTLQPGFSDGEQIGISVVTAIAVLFTMLFANTTLRSGGLSRLGVSGAALKSGIVPAMVGVIIIIPLIFVVGQGTEWVWKAIQLQHDDAHPFLRIFAEDSNAVVRWFVVISAIVLAPAFEELLFRGHIQTAATYSLSRLFSPSSNSGSNRAGIGSRWTAIVFTSIIFTAVHQQLWMMPPIFVLSLALGYAYERTGSLWVPILIHASFNAVNVLIFWMKLDH